MMDGWGVSGMMMWGATALILVLGVLVALIVFALSGRRGSDTAPDALEILRERYARGEIDRPEYEERVAVLRGRAPSERRR